MAVICPLHHQFWVHFIKHFVTTVYVLFLVRGHQKFLCTWWLQYRKLQVMFEVFPASLQTFIDTRLTLMPSVIPNSNYVFMVSDRNFKIFLCVFLYCNHQVHRLSDHPIRQPDWDQGWDSRLGQRSAIFQQCCAEVMLRTHSACQLTPTIFYIQPLKHSNLTLY
jgi:hypothetical protein